MGRGREASCKERGEGKKPIKHRRQERQGDRHSRGEGGVACLSHFKLMTMRTTNCVLLQLYLLLLVGASYHGSFKSQGHSTRHLEAYTFQIVKENLTGIFRYPTLQ